MSDAEHLNDLGIGFARQGRPVEAERAWREAIRHRPKYPKPYRNLGVLFMDSARFAEAADVLESLARLEPGSAKVQFDLGTSWLRCGHPKKAIAPLRSAIAIDPQHAAAHAHLGLAMEETGDISAATAALRQAGRLAPQSPVLAYHLGAIGGAAAPPVCPPDYLISLFDDYADRFDEDLLNRLHYAGPQLLADAVARAGATASSLDIIDIGCGTGLCGELLRPLASKMTGVDLSPRMIEASRKRAVYDHLLQCDAVEALRNRQADCDLITAADVFIYIGELDALFAAASAALRPGALFAFTIERIEEADFALRPTRRYAHSPQYIERLATVNRFKAVSIRQAVLRTPPPVDGCAILLQREL